MNHVSYFLLCDWAKLAEKSEISIDKHMLDEKYMYRMQIQFCQCLLTLTSNARSLKFCSLWKRASSPPSISLPLFRKTFVERGNSSHFPGFRYKCVEFVVRVTLVQTSQRETVLPAFLLILSSHSAVTTFFIQQRNTDGICMHSF